MLNDNTEIVVSNRNNGTTGYIIPETGVKRNFALKESKKITMRELRQLSYLPGGQKILADYLVVENQDAIEELLGGVEPEYFYSEEDIKTLLMSGSLDQLSDCLDFAPRGTVELVKDIAIKSELNDVQKREMIYKKTGLNITRAIEINKETSEEVKTDKPERKAAPIDKTEQKPTGRKAATTLTGKYNVVS